MAPVVVIVPVVLIAVAPPMVPPLTALPLIAIAAQENWSDTALQVRVCAAVQFGELNKLPATLLFRSPILMAVPAQSVPLYFKKVPEPGAVPLTATPCSFATVGFG